MRRRKPLVIAAVVVLLLAAAVFRLSPLWPGPGLPAGATRLHIRTEAPHLIPVLGCPAGGLLPVRIATSGDDMIFISEGTGQRIEIVWPSGWAAWRLNGRAELVDRNGSLVGREGEVLSGFGGVGGEDNAFHVCLIGG